LKKILVVGMLDSIHLARWISQLDGLSAQVVVTGTSPYRRIRPELLSFVQSRPEAFRIMEIFPKILIKGLRVLPAIAWIADQFLGDRIRGWALRRIINRVKPDAIHINELIVAGMPAEFALRKLKDPSTKLWVTNYGSELVWMAASDRYRARVSRLLSIADLFSAECGRDATLARNLGFKGNALEIFPVSGGILPTYSAEPHRNTISVKGYDNELGMGARALELVGEFLRANPNLNLEIVAYSCNKPTLMAGERLRKSGLKVETLKKGALSHREMISLFERSICYVGASRSDGISTSVLEAMSAGAIPIQTDSSCAGEWFLHEVSGFSVATGDLGQIKGALETIFGSDFDLDRARDLNYEVLRKNADPKMLREIALEGYAALI
jgi:hypothetical protein